MDNGVEYRSPSQARKRPRNPDNWKKSIAKKRRDSGQNYTSVKTGKPIEARKIGLPCTCKNKCFEVVGQENIQAIFSSFWASGSWDIQTAYIQKQVSDQPIKRRCTDNVDKQRACSRTYCVTAGDTEYVVCRVAFANIHGINPSRVRRAMNSMTATGVPVTDGRGKHDNHPKIPEHKQNLVKNHINQFPTVTNHYSRKTCPDVRYLEEHVKSKTHMWELYKIWLENHHRDEEPCSESYYKNILLEFFPEVKLSKPRTDTCKICDIYQIKLKDVTLTQESRMKIEAEYLEHHNKAQEGYKLTKQITG